MHVRVLKSVYRRKQHVATLALKYITLVTVRGAGFNSYSLKITVHNIRMCEGRQIMLLTSSTETGNTTRLREKGNNGEVEMKKGSERKTIKLNTFM